MAAFIGKCIACKRVIRSETRAYCDCRAGVDCDNIMCAPYSDDGKSFVLPHRHRATAVKYRQIKGVKSEKECGSACWSAKSDACACVCAGDNHGMAHVSR